MRDQLILIYSYLHGIWQYRWSALAISWIVVLAGWLIVYALPDQYTVKAVIHVDTESVMTPLLKGLSVDADVDEEVNIMSQLLLSRKNLEDVIRQTDLNLEVSDTLAMNNLVDNLARTVTLKEGSSRATKNVYELSYRGKTPELVYQVVSKLLNTMIETTLDSSRTDTEAAQKFIDRQITDYEDRLTAAEQRLAKFKRANIGFMPDKTGGYYKRLQREQDELKQTRSALRLAKRQLVEMRKQLKGELPLLGSSSYGNSQASKLRAYREELEILLTQFTEQHPDVQALRAIIAETVTKENDNVDEYVEPDSGDAVEFNPVYQELKTEIHKVSVEIETLKIVFKEQEQSVEVLKQSVDIIPGVEAQLSKLNRDYEITRERYLSLVERREAARMAQEVGRSGNNINFQIIEPPRVPTKPSGPLRLLLLTAVLLMAIATGLGWGFLRYSIQPTFIDTNQISDKIGLPVLGSVGLYLTDEHRKKRKMELVSFMLVFLLMLGSYGGVIAFSKSGSAMVNNLITSWKAVA